MDLQLEFLEPQTISDSQVDEVIHVVSKAFKDFNASVGATQEIVDEDFGDEETGPFVVKWFCKNLEGYAAVKDGKVVGVSFVDVHAAKGSKVAGLGPISSLAPGAGKKTLVAACDHVEKLGFSTQLLVQVASNSRSFSLYSKFGFEAKHTCQYVGGFLTSAGEEGSPAGSSGDGGAVTLKAMVAGDVEECADLFVATHGKGCGWDRRGNIELCLDSGNPFPMLVARDADGKVVGYSTGFYPMGHTLATSQDVFCAIFREGSRLHQQGGLPSPRFHCPVEFPGLISWVLSQQGLKIFRAMIIMARGPYEHTPWSSDGGYVVAPSIYGY